MTFYCIHQQFHYFHYCFQHQFHDLRNIFHVILLSLFQLLLLSSVFRFHGKEMRSLSTQYPYPISHLQTHTHVSISMSSCHFLLAISRSHTHARRTYTLDPSPVLPSAALLDPAAALSHCYSNYHLSSVSMSLVAMTNTFTKQ